MGIHKKLTGLLLFIFIVSLAGCSKKDSAESTPAETAGIVESEEASEEVPGENTDIPAETAELPTGHTADTVKIGFVDLTGTGLLSDVLGVARDKGFIEEELGAIGVTAELIPMTGAGPAINEALAGGSLDVGFLGNVPAIIGKSSDIDTQIITFSGLNTGASLVIPKDSGYTSVNDLKGKKIATQKGSLLHKVFLDILAANGLTVDDIEFVNVNSQGAIEALISGNVDGAVVSGSPLVKLIEGGYGKALVDYREHPEWNCGSYGLARTKYINENPDIIKALLRALVRAQKLTEEDDTILLQQWISTGETESSYEYLYPNHDNYMDIKKTEANVADGKNTIQFLLENDLITNEFNFEDWINSSFYEAAYSELGE